MKKFLIIAIAFIFMLLFFLGFCWFLLIPNHQNANYSEIVINHSGIYKIHLMEEDYYDYIGLVDYFLGKDKYSATIHTMLELKKFDFEFKVIQTINYDCGNGNGTGGSNETVILKDYFLDCDHHQRHIFDKNGKVLLNFPKVDNIPHCKTLDYNTNSIYCLYQNDNDFFLNIYYIDNMNKNKQIKINAIKLGQSFDLMDNFENEVLIVIYDKDKNYLSHAESEKLIPRSFLGHITDNEIILEELPLDSSNTRMFPSAIGKGVVVYYDYSQKDVFSYRTLDLKSSIFSEKIEIKIKGISNYIGEYFFNKENSLIITISKGESYSDDAVLLINLLDGKVQSKLRKELEGK